MAAGSTMWGRRQPMEKDVDVPSRRLRKKKCFDVALLVIDEAGLLAHVLRTGRV